MARGMVVGESIQSQASTDEFRDGYDRIFGDRKPQRGRWIWDEAQQKLVSAEEYEPPSHAVDGPIMSGRCNENLVAPDGTDIGTRARRKAWMKATGTADASDYTQAWKKAAAEKAARARGEFKPDKKLRDLIGRELYKAKIIL
jgi:hypothetical protein